MQTYLYLSLMPESLIVSMLPPNRVRDVSGGTNVEAVT